MDDAKDYQPWHAPDGRVSHDANALVIDQAVLSEIKTLLLQTVSNHFSAQTFSLLPECRKEPATKPLAELTEKKDPTDYIFHHFNQPPYFLAASFSKKMIAEYLEYFFCASKEYALPAEEKATLGYFDLFSLDSIAKSMTAAVTNQLCFVAQADNQDKSGQSSDCTYIEIHFKEKPEDFFISFMISESMIIQYLKTQHEKSKNKSINVNTTKISLTAGLLHKQLNLSDILNLKEGSLIPIDSKDVVSIDINGVEFMKGVLGSSNHNKAIKVSELKFSSGDLWKK